MRIVVGQGSCGVASGAKKTQAEFDRILEKSNMDLRTTITGCVGICFLEPIVDIYDDNEKLYRYVKVQPEMVEEIISEHVLGNKPVEKYLINDEDNSVITKQTRIVLRNCGILNPENIDEYIACGGYKSTEKVVSSMTQDDVINQIKVSGLRGRGGAGFPDRSRCRSARRRHGRRSPP